MMSSKGNVIVAQSGGPTAVINSSTCGVIQEALKSGKMAYRCLREFGRKRLGKKLPKYL